MVPLFSVCIHWPHSQSPFAYLCLFQFGHEVIWPCLFCKSDFTECSSLCGYKVTQRYVCRENLEPWMLWHKEYQVFFYIFLFWNVFRPVDIRPFVTRLVLCIYSRTEAKTTWLSCWLLICICINFLCVLKCSANSAPCWLVVFADLPPNWQTCWLRTESIQTEQALEANLNPGSGSHTLQKRRLEDYWLKYESNLRNAPPHHHHPPPLRPNDVLLLPSSPLGLTWQPLPLFLLEFLCNYTEVKHWQHPAASSSSSLVLLNDSALSV